MSKISQIQQIIKETGCSSILLTFLPDIRWASGFSGSNGLLLVTGKQAYLITDGRYKTQCEKEVSDARVFIAKANLLDCVSNHNLLPAGGSVIFQAEHVTFAQHTEFVQKFSTCNWIPKTSLLPKKVAVKTTSEIEHIRKAQQITDGVFDHILNFIRPGQSEKEISAEIIYQHLLKGASKMSFDPIVASGSNGALPHAKPTERRLAHGDLVVLDFGCVINGYASDMTRTISIGKPSEEAHEVYNTVLQAQGEALEAASAGISTSTLDHAARSVIEAAGYGPYFTHSLGHGVGLEIHEWPRISWQVDDILEENMVITIEPGVYLPGKFGVRIEDLIVLQADGCDILTESKKELYII